ncbi:MAG: TetR/AcrR family transcriptional regulator [Deinococcales bacterium]
MPRAFSNPDRDAIRRALVDAGEESFGRYGVRRTSVEQLAEAAGIAKGTFYSFFESKEHLCMAVFERLEDARREEMEAILARTPDPAPALEALMRYALELVAGDSLLTALRRSGELGQVVRRVGRERWSRHLERDRTFMAELVDRLRAMGARCQLDPDVMAGTMRAVILLGFHEEEIGAEVYEPVIEHMVRWVAQGIAVGRADGEAAGPRSGPEERRDGAADYRGAEP